MWAKIGVADPDVFMAYHSKKVSNNKEPPEEEKDPMSPLKWDFFTPPDTFFLHFSLALKKEFVNSLGNAATYYALIRKPLKTLQ